MRRAPRPWTTSCCGSPGTGRPDRADRGPGRCSTGPVSSPRQAGGWRSSAARDRAGSGSRRLVSINQPAMERIMLAALEKRASVDVRARMTLEARRRGRRGRRGAAPNGGGGRERVSARLVGCDGASSALRERLEIPFPGRTAPQHWIVVERVDRPVRKVPSPCFVGDPGRPVITSPTSRDATAGSGCSIPARDAAPHLEPAAVRRAIAPWLDGERVEIEPPSPTPSIRAWPRPGVVAVLLAGDAVHIMPPFIGQGLRPAGATRPTSRGS